MRTNINESYYKRLKELGGQSKTTTPSLSTSTLINFTRAEDGRAIGIIKENHSYYLKTSGSKKEQPGAEDFVFINGVENKFKYQYASLAEADKNRNFFLNALNESVKKKIKVISLNENESIAKAQKNADSENPQKAQGEADKNMHVNEEINAAQSHADSENPEKAQGEANKNMHSNEKLEKSADEKEPGEVKSEKEISVEKQASDKVVEPGKVKSEKEISVEKQTSDKVVKPGEVKSDQPIASDEAKVNENWNKKNVVDPKKKGMFKGKTKEELHKELTGAKKKGDTTKIKEIDFALRAKNKWGKVDEGKEVYEGHSIEEYGNEHPVSVEDALKEGTFPPSEDGATAAPAIPSPESTPATPSPEGGSTDSTLDAAASALDSMGVGSEPKIGGGEEPKIGGGDESGLGDGSTRDIEKLVGKLGQKIRTTDLTPEMVKGFMKSFISAMQDKLGELDHEEKRELANDLLKDKEEGSEDGSEMGGEEPAMGGEPKVGGEEPSMGGEPNPAAETSDNDEKEIEEAIDAHLAEMGIGEDANVENDENIASGTKPFKKYMAECGYDPGKVQEISLMEMVALMNGYTNECSMMENPDAQGMSEYVTPEVSQKMEESGNSLFENLMKPFGEKIKSNKKAYAAEAVVNEHFGIEDGDEEGGEEEPGEEIAAVSAPDAEAGEEGGENEPVASIAIGEEKPEKSPFAPAGEVIAAGAPGGAEKTVTIDLNANTVSMKMNETTQKKLEKIIAHKIQEHLTGKKTKLQESKKKSDLSTMLDKLIAEAFEAKKKVIDTKTKVTKK